MNTVIVDFGKMVFQQMLESEWSIQPGPVQNPACSRVW